MGDEALSVQSAGQGAAYSMANKELTIDVMKFIRFVLRFIWVPILIAAFACGLIYWRTAYRTPKTYTAHGTMYVYNSNPNLINYQYTSTLDLDSAVQLIDTYMIVVRSNKVLDVIVERLSGEYPGIEPAFVSSSLSMASISQTGVVSVNCVTGDPELSADICNAVLDVAPSEIIRVVGAGSIEIIDYATAPEHEDNRQAARKGILAGAVGGLLGVMILFLIFLFNNSITDIDDLTNNYSYPVLSAIPRQKTANPDPAFYRLSKLSPMELKESYARLRMNLLYILSEKKSHTVVVTSAVPEEGKTTIASNLALSCAISGKKVLLIDGDLRRGSQREVFGLDPDVKGLSEVLSGKCGWKEVRIQNITESLDLLPAGKPPQILTGMLESQVMQDMLQEMEQAYDLVLVDMPPVNLVTDPLLLSSFVAGCLIVIRQRYSHQAEVRDALFQAGMTGMDVLGFAFYGEDINQDSLFRKKYQKKYYSKYDYNHHPAAQPKIIRSVKNVLRGIQHKGRFKN